MNPTRRAFEVRSCDGPGLWFTDVSRYYSWATGRLAKLRSMHERIEAEDTDLPLGVDVARGEVSEARWSGYLERNMLSDTIVVFAAMAAEAFLNLYGVVRLGEAAFNAHFERLGVVPKTRQLLLICDSLSLSSKDPLVSAVSALADRRNALVHPKTKEAGADGAVPEKWKRPVLDNAEEAVAELNEFLREFGSLVPSAAHLLPHALRADASPLPARQP
jgi:hypothetical protein